MGVEYGIPGDVRGVNMCGRGRMGRGAVLVDGRYPGGGNTMPESLQDEGTGDEERM